jgi:hypothetical protein
VMWVLKNTKVNILVSIYFFTLLKMFVASQALYFW